MTAFFVTATGTDIGKTFVGAALLRHWRQRGLAAGAFKPLVSGIDPADPTGSDPAALLAALDLAPTPEHLDVISPWRFAAPLAPNMAARLEGKAVDYPSVRAACRDRIASHDGMLLVEGVGGVMAPITDDLTVLDWVADLGLPVLLVAGTYLGTISHILTAHAVLNARNLRVSALVLSETPGGTVPPADTIATLRPFLPADLAILHLPRLANMDAAANHPAVAALARHLTMTA